MDKKRWLILFLAVLLMFSTVPSWALEYLGQTNSLPNSNPGTEERWLEGILGRTFNDPSVNFLRKYESAQYFFPETNFLNSFDPEFQWTWAVVKIGRGNDVDDGWYAYEREGNETLTVGTYSHAISHVTFFGNGAQVPEPGTMLLLGLGLLGLGITTRRKS
jgi:hypothetical protein